MFWSHVDGPGRQCAFRGRGGAIQRRVNESRLFKCCTGFQTPGAEERTCDCRLAGLKFASEQDLNVCFRYGW